MMRLIFLVVIWVSMALSASAQSRLDRPFTSAGLTSQEVVYLQAMLSFEGFYAGRLDGRWGNGSSRALQNMTLKRFGSDTPNMRQVARMTREFSRQLDRQKWRPVLVPASGVSFQLPMAIVKKVRTGKDVLFSNKSGSLKIRTRTMSLAEAGLAHGWAAINAKGGKPDYQLLRQDLMVTSTRLANGDSLYIRSERRGAGFATTTVRWTADRQKSARLIVASLRLGAQEPLRMPRGGVLRQSVTLLNNAASKAVRPPVTPAPVTHGRFAGTGFYVNNTDVVTALGAVEGCAAPGLADGTRLSRVKSGPDQGIVLLTGARRSQSWLKIGTPGIPAVNARLVVRHRTRPAATVGEMATVRGFVIALTQVGERATRLLITVAPTRGGLGAPVFDDRGLLVGVVVQPPENFETGVGRPVSMVAPAGRLAAWLTRNRVLTDPAVGPTDPSVAAWQVPEEAIVSIFCQ